MAEAKVRKKRAWWKRALRGLLFTVIGLMLLLFLLTIILRLLYPPQKLKAMINESLQQSLNRSLTLGDVWIHPLRGLILEQVRLTPYPDSTAGYDLFPVRQVYIGKMALHYSLGDLLQRQVHITTIDIDEPDLEFYIDLLDTSAIDFAALLNTNLPVTLDLKALRFKNSKIRVLASDTLVSQELFIGDLSVYLDDVSLPRNGFAQNDSALNLHLRVESSDSPLHIGQKNLQNGSEMRTEARMDLSTRLDVSSFHDIGLHLRLDLDNITTQLRDPETSRTLQFPAAVRIETAIHGDGRAGMINIDSLLLAFDSEPWLRLNIHIDSLFAQPDLRLAVEHGHIPIPVVLQWLDEMAPGALPMQIKWMDQRAALDFSGTTLSGALDGEMHYQTQIALTHAGTVLNHDSIRVEELYAKLQSQGVLNASALLSAEADIQAGFDSLVVKQPGASDLCIGATRFQANTKLNERVLPEVLTFSLTLKNLLGTEISAEADLSGGASLQSLRGTTALYIDRIDFSRFPELAVQGEAAAQLSITLQTLKDIRTRVQVNTSELTLLQEEESIILPGLALSLNVLAGTDTSFAVIDLDSIHCTLNRLLEARAQAKFINSAAPRLHLESSELLLHHAAIWEYLPEVLREPYVEAQLTGTTRLAAHGDIQMPATGMQYNAAAQLTTSNTSFRAPAQFLSLDGIGLDLELSASSREGINLAAQIALDSFQEDQEEIIVFNDNRLSFNLSSRDLQSLRLEQGHLELPDLNTSGNFSLILNDVNGNTSVLADVALRQTIPDTLRLPQGMELHGDSDIRCHIQADTSLAKIRVDMVTRGLSFFMPGNMNIRDVESDLHIVQDIDLVGEKLIGSAAGKIATPSTAFMDYMVYRAYYQNQLPNLSRIRIGRVEVMDYKIEDIDLELQVGEGRLEVPALMAKIYGGNMGARLAVDLAEGDLSRARFNLNAHFANINSNLLLPKQAVESNQGIINANMDLNGIGLDMTQEMNLEGQLYITEIGPRVADNLLRSLDPQGTDSSIRTTRLLINRGFKPKLMTFLLRHGYLYPEIVFAQPWYFPIRLSGGKVELARIPLEFFLKNSMQRAAAR